jgi:hypothetical protein
MREWAVRCKLGSIHHTFGHTGSLGQLSFPKYTHYHSRFTELILSTHRVWVQIVDVGFEVIVDFELVVGHPGSEKDGVGSPLQAG